MICTIHNASASARIFYDVQKREVRVDPGCVRYADIDEGTYVSLRARSDLIVKGASFAKHAPPEPPPAALPITQKSPVVITGHFGIGDNLHQRAVIRELMPTHDVWLHTCHFNLYHDLIAQGLKLVMRATGLHAQAKTVAREQQQFADAKFPAPPRTARQLKIGYPKVLIDQHGSILEAMFGCVGLKMPERPDFSLPIKPEWRCAIREAISKWNVGGKPLMVHRPIVVRGEWDGKSRNPDPVAYNELYRSLRDRFFVVSIADLQTGREWIDGPRQNVDIELHKGELSFEEMAALFSEASMVFCNAGFAPVLAQAVGTPVVVVYGGRESFRTTQRVGAHLAPTLPIDVINPCDCHSAKHSCNKRIDLPIAQQRLQQFLEQRRSTLLFGTFYVDSPDRDALTDLWKRLHLALNDDCDVLAVDSHSPIKKFEDWPPYDGKRHRRMYFSFPDNIGHLSRPKVTLGRDGWGRAFCKGLEVACELGYEYVAHIEGDSLFRLCVSDVVKQMKTEGIDCASTNVHGLRTPGLDKQWIETGLLFFSTDYLRRSRFIERYNWPERQASPTPERYIRLTILEKDLDDKQLRIMPWKALRADKNQITKDNVSSLNLDWITHQHDSAQQDVYSKFVDMALKAVRLDGSTSGELAGTTDSVPRIVVPRLKLNLGCGTNKLAGWDNHDADVDITRRLPWANDSASHIFIEHCVEHVPYKAAIEFFKEAHRVLAPGGVLRVTVPSLEQIACCDDADYHRFTTKWQSFGSNKRGAMHAIIYAHGHEMVWNAQLLRDTLYFAAFDDVRLCKLGESDDPVLRGVEGHGRIIGEKFNRIESCSVEARKSGHLAEATSASLAEPVAIILGGAECWQQDLEEARKIIGNAPVRFFLVNDQIKSFPESGIACTLHPDKLNGHFAWLVIRRKAGLPDPDEVWSHRKHAAVTHDTASNDWRGSSGLFAVQVARRKGHRKIIGCGVPMTVDGNHFERHIKWQSAIAFRDGWKQRKNEIAPYFRSLSGWTRQEFGEPDADWIASQ